MTATSGSSGHGIKVALVTGNRPPDPCGVGDYADALYQALDAAGVQVDLVISPRDRGNEVAASGATQRGGWGLRHGGALLQSIARVNPDVVHLQYPTAAYKAGLAPQVLALVKRPLVVTLHEASAVHLLRKAAIYPFLARAKAVIMTTRYEAEYVCRMYPPVRKRVRVIPIGSSIPPAQRSATKSSDVIYFGLIAPNKGIETFLEAATISARAGLGWRFVIVGKVAPGAEHFFNQLRLDASKIGVSWNLDLSADDVAVVLANAAAAYLPYPDGASGRRSSLVAALANGLPTITTRGLATPGEFVADETVIFASSPAEAVGQLEALRRSTDLSERMSRAAARWGGSSRWDAIATRHLSLYRQLLDG